MTKQITSRQLALSVFTGLSAPLAVTAGAMAWPAVLLGLSVGGALLWLLPSEESPSTLRRSAYLLWTLLMMAKTAALSRLCFQESTVFVPVVLLALAAASSRRNVSAALGTILWPVIAALLGGPLLCAVQDFHWSRFTLAQGDSGGWTTALALALAPTVLRVLTSLPQRGLRHGWCAAAAMGLTASVICSGVLGSLRPQMAQQLYQMLRGVSILGVAERLEALLSAVLCIGFFIALSLLCAVCTEMVRPYLSERVGRWGSTGVAAAVLALYRPVAALPAAVWPVLAVGFGVLLPLTEKLWKKRSKKRKKRLDRTGRA